VLFWVFILIPLDKFPKGLCGFNIQGLHAQSFYNRAMQSFQRDFPHLFLVPVKAQNPLTAFHGNCTQSEAIQFIHNARVIIMMLEQSSLARVFGVRRSWSLQNN